MKKIIRRKYTKPSLYFKGCLPGTVASVSPLASPVDKPLIVIKAGDFSIEVHSIAKDILRYMR